MKERCQELIARLLDDELASIEAAELTDLLRRDPAVLADLRRHLALWELFAQQNAPPRSAEAFMAGCQTRFAAELDQADFVERTAARLEGLARPDRWSISRVWLTLQTIVQSLRSKVVLSVAASLAVCVLLAVMWLCPVSGEPALMAAAGAEIIIERGTEMFAAKGATKLQPGDVLRAATNATATITFAPEHTRVDIRPGTELKLTRWSRGKNFELREGTMEANVARQRPFGPMLILTPQAEVRVLGTKFMLTVTDNATHLDVAEGKVRLTRRSDGALVVIAGGLYTVAATNRELAALPQTGGIRREYWTNLANNVPAPAGSTLKSKRSLVARPDGFDYLPRFESVLLGRGLRFTERIRGYVHPPKTGLYRLALNTVHVETVLLLSRTDRPEDVVQVAFRAPNGVGPSLQEVTPVPLQAGRKYYVEVVHESDGGDDQLAVSWQAPGGQPEIIPGKFLSPFPTQEKKGQR